MLAIVRRKEHSRVSFIYLCPSGCILMKHSIWLLGKMAGWRIGAPAPHAESTGWVSEYIMVLTCLKWMLQ